MTASEGTARMGVYDPDFTDDFNTPREFSMRVENSYDLANQQITLSSDHEVKHLTSSVYIPSRTRAFGQDGHLSGRPFVNWIRFDEEELAARAGKDATETAGDDVKVSFLGIAFEHGLGGALHALDHKLFKPVNRRDMLREKRILLRPNNSESLSARRLAMLEDDLFSTTKYHDGSDNHLTVITFASDEKLGTITLFEIKVGAQGEALNIHPVAAMEEVPKAVLVDLRRRENIRKVVMEWEEEGARYHSNIEPKPSYVRLRSSSPDRLTATVHGRSSSTHSRRSSRGRRLNADGILATIPHFLALLHGNRSILESVSSSHVKTVNTSNGRMRTVDMTSRPRGRSHNSGNVHVAVLLPDRANWTEESMYWSIHDDLVELRGPRYWDLIEADDL